MRTDKLGGDGMTHNTRTHVHYRPYFILRNGAERYGIWHHSKRKAWAEVARIVHNEAIEWTTYVVDYGVGVLYAPGTRNRCEVQSWGATHGHVDNAGNSVAYELHLYANTIAEEYREDFFHPMNRDAWVLYFCEWLATKQRKSAEVRASND